MSIKKRQKIVDRFNDPHVSGISITLLSSFLLSSLLSTSEIGMNDRE